MQCVLTGTQIYGCEKSLYQPQISLELLPASYHFTILLVIFFHHITEMLLWQTSPTFALVTQLVPSPDKGGGLCVR